MEEPTKPWFVHHPDHMKGWEAFGVVPTNDPIVRQLGTGYDGKGKPGTTPWGKGEIKLGVGGIEIGTFADSPEGAYIYVVGTERDDVERRWHVAAAAFAEIQDKLWPKTR